MNKEIEVFISICFKETNSFVPGMPLPSFKMEYNQLPFVNDTILLESIYDKSDIDKIKKLFVIYKSTYPILKKISLRKQILLPILHKRELVYSNGKIIRVFLFFKPNTK